MPKRKRNSSISKSTSSKSKSKSKSKSSSKSTSKSSSKSSSTSNSILTDELEGIYAELEDRDDEVCGFLKSNKKDNYLELDEQENISTDYTRNNCQTRRYKKLIYHTHPFVSKSYPSMEDIFKIIKNKIIKVSIIFTRWGIWELHCNKKSNNIPKDIIIKVNEQLTNIYQSQNNGRGELRSKSLLQKSINNINKILFIYDFKLYFSEWDFQNDYVLRT